MNLLQQIAERLKTKFNDITNALIGKQSTSEKNQANGYAGLDATGKIDSSVLPALAIGETFVVADQASMLALTAQRGDIAVRDDINKTFRLVTDDPTLLANWIELKSPTGTGVLSFNTRTGAVTLVDTDVTAVAGTYAEFLTQFETGLL